MQGKPTPVSLGEWRAVEIVGAQAARGRSATVAELWIGEPCAGAVADDRRHTGEPSCGELGGS